MIVVLGILIFSLSLTMPAAGADSDVSLERKVKAAFLYNFPKFIEWPESTSKDFDNSMIFGFVGAVDLKNAFDFYTAQTIHGKTVVARQVFSTAELAACDVLFFGSANAARLTPLLESLQGKAVLTVGESEEFIDQGGMIKFFLDQGRLRFEINLEAAERVGIKISPNLLMLAKISPK